MINFKLDKIITFGIIHQQLYSTFMIKSKIKTTYYMHYLKSFVAMIKKLF